MKYELLLLNYDSEWVVYCSSPTLQYAVEACVDLRHHGFQEFQTKIVKQ